VNARKLTLQRTGET